MIFSNEILDIEQIPQYEEQPFVLLEKNHQKVNVVSTIVFFIGLLIVLILLPIFLQIDLDNSLIIIIYGFWFLLFIFFSWLSYKAYFYKGYILRSKDLMYKSGIFFKSIVAIPFNRVQHSEINQGIIDRKLGLASLSIFTAGGSSSDLTISGLSLINAHKLKEIIGQKVTQDEEE